ncbi:unnamed protein product, partial [Lepidochelys kempii]
MGRKDKGEQPDPAPYGGNSVNMIPRSGARFGRGAAPDIICCILFVVFLAGYIVVGILAWLYGDPRQVIYPRNSTGSYCGIGGNRGKPYVLYFDLLQCVTSLNILATAMNGLQCPTTQICVASCPDAFWVVPPVGAPAWDEACGRAEPGLVRAQLEPVPHHPGACDPQPPPPSAPPSGPAAPASPALGPPSSCSAALL